ncbi:Putative NADPH-quinone reductase (modulator of drug activity B) [Salinibacillus kushneri]|uniref:Putative NADPH-quinone reductase (Modulator of drug activity B) n=1 Tax=Salinibacillus kushneri TaxID=237682 RepID=A0A1I0F9F0_9BACI|nr:NAD(P)H-dependent oxidoreductase [Salinibacillus kushneri]SET54444.1 Putative NADPH-quinone reductase (modulator of drug activity B) [Salinibacillus kushneri]
MRTLLIVSHPEIIDSYSQQYFLNGIKDFENVTVHHLENVYPAGNIDIKKEQELLREHDRIIFQFPFYWYSSPPLLKHWQDVVLEEGVTHGPHGGILAGKEFGLVLMIGVSEKEYQAGGSEQFTISELTRPFQAMANKTGMKYLRPFQIFQFPYTEDDQKMDILIPYWQKLTMENNDSLATREKWLVDQLEYAIKHSDHSNEENILEHAKTIMEENQSTIDDLKIVLDQMYHR